MLIHEASPAPEVFEIDLGVPGALPANGYDFADHPPKAMEVLPEMQVEADPDPDERVLLIGDESYDGSAVWRGVKVEGGTGDNWIRGTGFRDRLIGDAGDDTIYGGGGDDDLVGGAGDDALSGGSGNDWLFGGTDNDTLTGGSGKDRFDFRPGDGRDTITDFTVGDDRIVLLGFGEKFDTFAEVMAAGKQVGADFGVTLPDANGKPSVIILKGVDGTKLTRAEFDFIR